MSECSSPKGHSRGGGANHSSFIDTSQNVSNINGLSVKKLTEHVHKVDLSRIYNFVSASQFTEVQTLRAKIDSLQKENDELT